MILVWAAIAQSEGNHGLLVMIVLDLRKRCSYHTAYSDSMLSRLCLAPTAIDSPF
jgi:hypothetical protein